ncbi:PTS sugar transporter subunit IIA [uncultured Aeromicrobium sp.]|uniref:PTS sugar transporter subunit IIA n=1 Tax=uncultured Aeromicrobium sp. TaxID=337820 RepID=UPI0025D4C6B1|nr:PTS sugar transporter subunit IIA [uncultured Aeromicrobium sp.]
MEPVEPLDPNEQHRSLIDRVPEHRLAAQVDVANWEEAVAVAGRLMEADDLCTAEYVAAMQDGVREYGPYVVVAPGVAMPHARPESGVQTPGVAIVTLREPVEFGHATNDPVDLVIAFGAVDKDAHLATLQDIVALIQDSDRLAAVRHAGDVATLHAALRR